jgi:hypothetical protein
MASACRTTFSSQLVHEPFWHIMDIPYRHKYGIQRFGQAIDHDPSRSTGMVTFDLTNTGITFQLGNCFAVMLINASHEVAKISAALGLDGMMDAFIPLEQGSEWARVSKHPQIVSKRQDLVLDGKGHPQARTSRPL